MLLCNRHLGATPPQQSPVLSSAASVYGIKELRCRILRNLARKDLVMFLRVEKAGMFEVAKEVYGKMTYERAQRINSEHPVRLQLYLEAELGYRTYGNDSDPDEVTESDAGGDLAWQMYSYISEYTPLVFRELVPDIMDRYSALRRLEFGRHGDEELDSWYDPFFVEGWVFNFHGTERGGFEEDADSNGLEGSLGHIDVFSNIGILPEDAVDPPHLPPPRPPSSAWTIARRCNLQLDFHPPPAPPPCPASWIEILLHDTQYGNLWRAIDLDLLPITMSLLVALYRRQLESGYRQRLDWINAPSILSWNLHDFGQFSAVASTSLRYLRLFPLLSPLYQEDNIQVTFADLDNLIEIIHRDLPCLEVLHLPVRGVETAELVCRDMLSPDCLEAKGSLRDLIIFTAIHNSPPFNILRVASRMCRPSGYVRVMSIVDRPLYHATEESVAQRRYLDYLRNQPEANRKHLATADFTLLQITSLAEVDDLSYHADGRPKSKGEVKGGRWARVAKSQRKVLHDSPFPLMDDLSRLGVMAERFAAVSTGAVSAGMLQEAERVLEAAEKAKMTSETLVEEMEKIARARSQAERNIRQYVELLREQVGADN